MTSPQQARRIVVGVDGSASSVAALRWAARLADWTGACVHVIAAWTWPITVAWPYPVVIEEQLGEQALKRLTETVDAVFGAHRPRNLELEVRQGHAARVLLDAAHDAEMLVVGSRGHGGFAGLLLGSVSSHCAEHAGCPVLVVHDSAARAIGDESAFFEQNAAAS